MTRNRERKDDGSPSTPRPDKASVILVRRRPGSAFGQKKRSGEDRPRREAEQQRDQSHSRQAEESADDDADHARKGEDGKAQCRRHPPAVPPKAGAGQRQGQAEGGGGDGGQDHLADHRLPEELGAETNEALQDQSDR